MPPDRPPLPSSVLAALGLVAASGCGPCLDVAACLDFAAHTGLLDHSGVSACLTSPLEHTGAPTTAETGAGHSATPAPLPPSPSAPVFERLATEGVLPPDVIERLSHRGR
jgi:hypothetical protein